MSTRLEIKRKIKKPLDMEDELFVEEDELNDYIDEAHKECSALIHNLYEDYFLTDEVIELDAGENSYDLPEDIYARKIRKILFDDGSNKYEVLPLRIENIPYVDSDESFRYRIRNSADDGEQIVIYPTPVANDDSSVRAYYIRDVILPTSDSDTIDIPEFDRFIIEYTRLKILEKEMDNPMLETTRANFEKIRDLMIRTLQDSILDSNNEIELGDDIYSDFYSNFGWGRDSY